MKVLDLIKNTRNGIAILIDPDKFKSEKDLLIYLDKVSIAEPDFVFVGGRTVSKSDFQNCVRHTKEKTDVPVVIFPGASHQLSEHADAILFLSLISGRNPDYLIGKHVASVPWFEKHKIEAISTAYILVDGNVETSIQRVTKTKPISRSDETLICNTAKASEILGFKCVYLEAGSGAEIPISQKIIEKVKSNVNLPLIVGGGIKTKQQIDEAHRSGADIVVIGNALEASPELINTLV